jgi:DNA polymerase I-like protein with 3'-5' exonuclease and polymerase domains
MSEPEDLNFEELEAILSGVGSVEPTPPAAPSIEVEPLEEPLEESVVGSQVKSIHYTNDAGVSPEDFNESMGLKTERDINDIAKPWMQHHKFILVKTVAEVESIVEEALADGHCSLDLETEGLDNRIVYNAEGKPETVHKIVGFCLSIGKAEKGYYIPVRHKPMDGGPVLNVEPVTQVEAAIKRLCLAAQPTPKPGQTDLLGFRELETPPRVIIDFWHAKFDQEFLYPITGIDWWHPDGFEDGLLAYFVVYSADKALGLKPKAAQLLRDLEGHPYEMIELKELFPNRRKINFSSLAPDEPSVIKYAASDAICTRLLCARKDLLPVIQGRDTWAFTYRLEKQVSQVVRVMERNRVRVNRERVVELRDAHRLVREEYRAKIIALAEGKGFSNFEPGSPKQLSDFLFTERGLDINPKPTRNEKSGQYKTDWDSLHALTEELGENAPMVLKWVISYREEDKVLGTYLESLSTNPDSNDELRFNFKQTGAATGRFSAPAGDPDHGYSGVPIHGMPTTSDLRQVFEARDGYTMVKCDYAGQELRIVANLSNEPVWIKEFLEGTGDLHTITAKAFFNKQEVTKAERAQGKIANFSLVYGGGPQAIIRATGCDKMEATRRKQAFDKAVPTFAKWVKGQHDRVKKDLGVHNAYGRWMSIPDANIKVGGRDSNGRVLTEEQDVRMLRAACERYSLNYPIQSSGADIMKISMILLHKEFHKRGWLKNGGDDSVRMLLSVHDELVFEIKHDLVVHAVPIIVDLMERPTKMIRSSCSPTWKVPLITEPLVGPTWGTGYPCERAKSDYKLKEGETLVNGFVYGVIRTVDLGKEKPGKGEVEHFRDEKSKKLKLRFLEPQWLLQAGETSLPSPAVAVTPGVPSEAPVTADSVQAAQTPSHAPELHVRASGQVSAEGVKIAVIRLKATTRLSVDLVRGVVARFLDPTGSVLRLMDGFGATLIDPKLRIRVQAEKVAQALVEIHLSDGKIGSESATGSP